VGYFQQALVAFVSVESLLASALVSTICVVARFLRKDRIGRAVVALNGILAEEYNEMGGLGGGLVVLARWFMPMRSIGSQLMS
jgi:hypothetical protein